jgi:hypothetical protein
MKAVKPVYDKSLFEVEKKKYLNIKRNISTSANNYRNRMKKSMHENTRAVKRIKRRRPQSAASAVNMKSYMSTKPNNNSFGPTPNSQMKRRKNLSRPKSAVQLRNNRILVVNDRPRSRFKHASMSIRPRSAHIKVKTGGTGMYNNSRFSGKGGTGNIFIL